MIASGGQSSSRRLFAGYHAYVAGVCLVSLTAQPLLFGVLALGHAAAAVALFRWAGRPAPAGGSPAGALWPWGLWFLGWIEIGRFTAWRGRGTFDAGIIDLDLAVFGVHLHEYLPAALPAPVTDVVMQGAYLSYYFLLLGPLLGFAGKKRRHPTAQTSPPLLRRAGAGGPTAPGGDRVSRSGRHGAAGD